MVEAHYVSDRERMEAEEPQAVLNLADAFRDKLSDRRALLLTLAKLAFEQVGAGKVLQVSEETSGG